MNNQTNMTEGSVRKGGQNPTNTSVDRPLAPQGSGADSVSQYPDRTEYVCQQITGRRMCPSAGKAYPLITETEKWGNTKLAVLQAVLDTLCPGARFVVMQSDNGAVDRIYLTILDVENRERDIVQSLRDLADSIDVGLRMSAVSE